MTKGKKAAVIAAAVVMVLCLSTTALGVYMYQNGNFRQIHPFTEPKDGQIKVACVGDSITYGYGIKGWKENAYPVVLGRLLGNKYCVNGSDRRKQAVYQRKAVSEKPCLQAGYRCSDAWLE